MSELIFTLQADSDLRDLEADPAEKPVLRTVRKTLGFLETNLRHPSLQTHEYTSLKGSKGEKVFAAYTQQRTPSAYRVFGYYGPEKDQITVATIIPHP